jgi:molybdenum cofactor cytidylyltransferase
MTFACIVLAAGESSRFGSPKALASLRNQTIIEHIQHTLINAVDEVIIVLGANAEQIKPHILQHKKIQSVINPDYKLGQTSSLLTGLKSLIKPAAFFVLPVDCPLVQSTTFNQLKNEFTAQKARIVVPAYNEKKGHPPLFHPDLKREILHLKASEGLNLVIHRHAEEICVVPTNDSGVVLTFNTPQELKKIQELS